MNTNCSFTVTLNCRAMDRIQQKLEAKRKLYPSRYISRGQIVAEMLEAYLAMEDQMSTIKQEPEEVEKIIHKMDDAEVVENFEKLTDRQKYALYLLSRDAVMNNQK